MPASTTASGPFRYSRCPQPRPEGTGHARFCRGLRYQSPSIAEHDVAHWRELCLPRWLSAGYWQRLKAGGRQRKAKQVVAGSGGSSWSIIAAEK